MALKYLLEHKALIFPKSAGAKSTHFGTYKGTNWVQKRSLCVAQIQDMHQKNAFLWANILIMGPFVLFDDKACMYDLSVDKNV